MSTAEFVDARMTAAADDPLSSATDLAEHLVEHGTPFREAHSVVGGLVRQAVERGVPLDELVSNDPRLGPDCLGLLQPGSAVRRRTTPGGAGPEPVARQLDSARALARTAGVARAVTASRATSRGRALPRAFYDRDALDLAPELLNKLLVRTGDGPRLAARIVEVGGVPRRRRSGQSCVPPSDAAQRDDVRPTRPSVRVLLLRQSLVHERGERSGWQPHAVLLRAAAPLAGVDTMRERRGAARRDRELCAGPGRLGQAFGVDRSHDGLDLVRGRIRIVDDGVAPPARPGVSPRIGLAAGKGEQLPYRFYVEGDENVSAKPR